MSSIVGFTTADYLMLDVDNRTPTRIYLWTKSYSKRYHLGCALINITSDTERQLDLFGNRLYHLSVIFGVRQCWEEIVFHIGNAFKDGIVDKKFVKMRYIGVITERVTVKSNRISYPRPFHYIRNSNKRRDKEGVFEYLRFWQWHKKVNILEGSENGWKRKR